MTRLAISAGPYSLAAASVASVLPTPPRPVPRGRGRGRGRPPPPSARWPPPPPPPPRTAPPWPCRWQGITLLHFSTQPQPFSSPKTIYYPMYPPKGLTLSRTVDERKPLVAGARARQRGAAAARAGPGRRRRPRAARGVPRARQDAQQRARGRAVQVEPMKPMLKAPESMLTGVSAKP